MGFDDIKEAIIVGVLIAFMIGPVFFMLIETSILKGFRAAFVFDIGVVFGDAVFLLIAFFGSLSIVSSIENNPLLIKIGGAILVIYGLITFLNKKQKRIIQDETLVVAQKSNYFHLFVKGFLLNIINVGVLGFWLGMIVYYTANFQMNELKILKFFSIVLATYLIVDIGKILLAKTLRDKMTPPIVYKMKRIMGIILIIFGLALFSKDYIPDDKIPLKGVIEKHIP